MSILSPEEKLFAAIFGGLTPEQERRGAAEKAASDAAQAEKDWAEARQAAIAAAEYFPDYEWTPAVGYGWQSCALAVLPDGSTRRAERFGDGIRHQQVPEMDIHHYDIKGPYRP